jgi:hypothetical protein
MTGWIMAVSVTVSHFQLTHGKLTPPPPPERTGGPAWLLSQINTIDAVPRSCIKLLHKGPLRRVWLEQQVVL